MGLRFRRSINLFPGARLNLSLKSYSVSFGIRGARYTTGTRGRRATIGLPGTGLSFTQHVGPPSRTFKMHVLLYALALLILFALGLALITFLDHRALVTMPPDPPLTFHTFQTGV
jgi:hypothetical protein